MNPHQNRSPRKHDALTQEIMDKGIANYFSSLSSEVVVADVKGRLLSAASKIERFLQGEGRNSDLARGFDDLDVAGLRSAASWIGDNVQLSADDFRELFGIATSGNMRPAPGQSDADVYSQFQQSVVSFIEINGFGV